MGAMEPLVRDPGAADKTDGTVDNQQFTMSAIAQVSQPVPCDAVVPVHLAAGFEQRPKIPPGGAGASKCVEHDVHLHAGPRPLHHRFKILAADAAFLEDVGFQVDAATG